ncbi:hypothetical protein PLICRDRAFT_44655 [Plicaturopsis crispa FD-325 SS-3]|nr:hypothetical protein PLICRDRAFT_44655 [Plicaturopsis crispa FD-325 SS-3]
MSIPAPRPQRSPGLSDPRRHPPPGRRHLLDVVHLFDANHLLDAISPSTPSPPRRHLPLDAISPSTPRPASLRPPPYPCESSPSFALTASLRPPTTWFVLRVVDIAVVAVSIVLGVVGIAVLRSCRCERQGDEEGVAHGRSRARVRVGALPAPPCSRRVADPVSRPVCDNDQTVLSIWKERESSRAFVMINVFKLGLGHRSTWRVMRGHERLPLPASRTSPNSRSTGVLPSDEGIYVWRSGESSLFGIEYPTCASV